MLRQRATSWIMINLPIHLELTSEWEDMTNWGRDCCLRSGSEHAGTGVSEDIYFKNLHLASFNLT
jgi:hypothetical protein